MSYQFEIYPTSHPRYYRPIVNSPSGVSAIRNKAMGINENSLSGVALYINKIENWFSTYAVGSGCNRITSGYFKDLGYIQPLGRWNPHKRYEIGDTVYFKDKFWYCDYGNENTPPGEGPYWTDSYWSITDKKIPEDWPYTATKDGICSGVHEIYTSGVTAKPEDKFYAKKLVATSGTFFNMIFDKQCFDDPKGSYFTKAELLSGNLNYYYNGYDDDKFEGYTEAKDIDYGDPKTWPHYISNEGITLNNIVGDYNYGVYEGGLHGRDILVSGDIWFSGNLHISNGLIDLSNFRSEWIEENVIDFDTHTHSGGANGQQLGFETLDSTKPPTEEYSIVLSSGDIISYGNTSVQKTGLYTGWEIVDMPDGIDEAQGLYTLNDRLYVYDKTKIREADSYYESSTKNNFNIHGVSTVTDEDVNGGQDSIAIFSCGRTNTTNDKISHNIFRYTIPWSWTNKNSIQYPTTYHEDVGYRTYTEKRIDYINDFHRIYDEVYYTSYDKWADSRGWALSLWQLPQHKIVGIAETEGVTTADAAADGMIFMKSFRHDGKLVYPYKIKASGDVGMLYYDPMFTPSGLTLADGIPLNAASGVWGDFIWSPTSSGNPLEANITTDSTQRCSNDYCYYKGRVYYLFEKDIYKCDMNDKCEPVFFNTPLSGHMSLVSYAGKLWTDRALEVSYDYKGRKTEDWRIRDSLDEIVRNIDEPWVTSPVVYRGWLYALAPKINLTDWMNETFSDQFRVNYYIPNALLVRRRASELDISEYGYAYTV